MDHAPTIPPGRRLALGAVAGLWTLAFLAHSGLPFLLWFPLFSAERDRAFWTWMIGSGGNGVPCMLGSFALAWVLDTAAHVLRWHGRQLVAWGVLLALVLGIVAVLEYLPSGRVPGACYAYTRTAMGVLHVDRVACPLTRPYPINVVQEPRSLENVSPASPE